MRSLAVFVVVSCALFFAAPPAEAHGGGSFRDPQPGLMCDCARVACEHCSDTRLRSADTLLARRIERTVQRRWDDFEAVRFTLHLKSPEKAPPAETHLPIQEGTLFAATGGSIEQGGATLTAALLPSREARRKYLFARARGIDPFLLLPEGPGRFLLRAFPVRHDGETVVTIEGFALAAARRRGEERLYRTDDRFLLVRDLAVGTRADDGAFADEEGARSLAFLSIEEARIRVGGTVDCAVRVPFVHAIEEALRGKGERVLAALPTGAPMPPESPFLEPPAPPA